MDTWLTFSVSSAGSTLRGLSDTFRAAYRRTARVSPQPGRESAGIYILLAAIIGFAAIIRWMECFRGLPYIHNWDEPYVASRALNMVKTGSWNPELYGYGGAAIYLNMFLDIIHYLYLMGQPEASLPSLSKLDDIQTYVDTGYF